MLGEGSHAAREEQITRDHDAFCEQSGWSERSFACSRRLREHGVHVREGSRAWSCYTKAQLRAAVAALTDCMLASFQVFAAACEMLARKEKAWQLPAPTTANRPMHETG